MTAAVETASRQAPLKVAGLVKSFGPITVLDLQELEIRPGEFHAVIGQNGSGKSTLIKVLAGFHRPDSYVLAQANGRDVALGEVDTPSRAGWRFVHQDLGLVGALDTVDNLALGTGYRNTSAGRIRWRREVERARSMIDSLGYSFDVRLPVRVLAPVEKTAVAIARALGELDHDISMLVLDEPTATMPRPEVERLLALAHRVTAQGVAVFYVSHHLDEVLDAADRVTVLRDGKLVSTTSVSSVTSKSLVEMMTGGMDDQAPRRAEAAGAAVTPVVRIHGLTGAHVRDFSLDLHAGEIVGIAGITGSGRDELCGLIFGSRPRKGEVRVGDSLLKQQNPPQSVELGIGYVPANRLTEGLIPTLSVRENVTLVDLSKYWRVGRLRNRQERADVAALREQFGVQGSTDESPIARLSGGNQQKVSIAKWMRLTPQMLLLDEPTQGIDVAAQAEIHKLIDQAAAQGMAVLVCSSDEAELARLCSKVLVLRDGLVKNQFSGTSITRAALIHASQVSDEPVERGANSDL